MMKPLKLSLRVWIAMTSLLSFLGGWALFSHSGKPAPLFSSNSNAVPQTDTGQADTSNSGTSTLAPLPTLQPLPSLNGLTSNSQVQPLPALQAQPRFSFNNVQPQFRTRGS